MMSMPYEVGPGHTHFRQLLHTICVLYCFIIESFNLQHISDLLDLSENAKFFNLMFIFLIFISFSVFHWQATIMGPVSVIKIQMCSVLLVVLSAVYMIVCCVFYCLLYKLLYKGIGKIPFLDLTWFKNILVIHYKWQLIRWYYRNTEPSKYKLL